MKNNAINNTFNLIYSLGFFIILALPLLALQPWFLPPDFGKTVVFRSVMAILLFLFALRLLYKKQKFDVFDIKKNKILWILTGLFLIFFIASIFSVDPHFSFWGNPIRSGGFINFAFYIMFAIISFVLFKKDDWEKAWFFSIFVGVLVSLMAVIQFYGLFNKIFISVLSKPVSTLGNANFLTVYLLLLLFITLCFTIKSYGNPIKDRKKILAVGFYLFALVLFLYVIVITGTRAAYLGLLVGSIYFVLFYPKRLSRLKIVFCIFLLLIVALVWYANTHPKLPEPLQQSQTLQAIYPRLSISQSLRDTRFYAWQISLKALQEKPLLGWGPENFSVGFDKHYDPSLPHISKIGNNWWDRAHNIILDIGMQAGVLAIVIYLSLFVAIFWHFRKLKNQPESAFVGGRAQLMAHGVQTTLVAYLTANIFSFDSFSSYLLFFLLIGYSLHLIYGPRLLAVAPSTQEYAIKKDWLKNTAATILLSALVLFLWQYNFVPLRINAKINTAGALVYQKNCRGVFFIMDDVLARRSFLDAYARLQYMYFTQGCATEYPGGVTAYNPRIMYVLEEAAKIHPLYTRFWIFLGTFANIQASLEKNPDQKTVILETANTYLQKADMLSPNHQEIIIEQIKTYMLSGDYENMKNEAQKCVATYPEAGECYWLLGISKIYDKDFASAKKYMETASQKEFNTHSILALYDLADAYSVIKDYKNLSLVYEQLIESKPTAAQYHASLAFIYRELGEYQKARKEALALLKLAPEKKDEVDAFLQTLPY